MFLKKLLKPSYDVYEDLKGIQDTLSIVKDVFLDAEEKKEQKHGLRAQMAEADSKCMFRC